MVPNKNGDLTKKDIYKIIKKKRAHPILYAEIFVISKLEQTDSFHPICIEATARSNQDLSRIRSQNGYNPNSFSKLDVSGIYKHLLLTRFDMSYSADWKKDLLKIIKQEQ